MTRTENPIYPQWWYDKMQSVSNELWGRLIAKRRKEDPDCEPTFSTEEREVIMRRFESRFRPRRINARGIEELIEKLEDRVKYLESLFMKCAVCGSMLKPGDSGKNSDWESARTWNLVSRDNGITMEAVHNGCYSRWAEQTLGCKAEDGGAEDK